MSTTPESPRSEANREMARARDEAQDLARTAADTAQRRGREEIDKVKAQAADKAEQIADALDTSADDLEGNGGDALSGYGHSMASLMRRLAGGLRERDIEDFASELSDYARRSPAMFLAGSVALGFGISRFLKASSSRSHDLDQGYELDDDYDVDSYEEEYEFDTTIEPSAGTGAEDLLEPSPRPEAARRAADDTWPRAPGDADAGPVGSMPGSSSSSGSRPSDGSMIQGGNDRG